MIYSSGVVTRFDPGMLADAEPIGPLANYYPTSSGLVLSGSTWASYAHIYRTQNMVNTVIRKLAYGAARLPFRVMNVSEAGKEPADDTPFGRLMARPNDRINSFFLWVWTSATFDIYGEAYWWKVRGADGAVRELQLLHPQNIEVRRTESGALEYWYMQGSRRDPAMKPFPEADIVPFVNYNPANTLRGLSNLEALRQVLLNEDAARRATASFWERGARPSIILKHPRKLSDQAHERLRRMAEARHGGSDNTGTAMILEEDMDATIVQLTAEEMQYIESRRLTNEEVCAAYDIPPTVVHLLEHATFSNITEQMRSLYRDTMPPRLGVFEAAIRHHLQPEFDASGALQGAFDLDEVLRGDFESRAAAVAPLVGNGVFKPAEARQLFGLPETDEAADKLYASANLQPLGAAKTGAAVAQPLLADAPLPAELPAAASLVTRSTMRLQSLADYAAETAAHVVTVFARQAESVRKSLAFDPALWNRMLAEALAFTAETVARAAGTHTAAELGGHFDFFTLAPYLGQNVEWAAANVNATTAQGVHLAMASPDPHAALALLFGDVAHARAAQIGRTRTTTVASLAALAAADQNGARSKTWHVTSANPRAGHAALDGSRVTLDATFANGQRYPGDPAGSSDDIANCTCTLTFA